jgi:hypothetical protein
MPAVVQCTLCQPHELKAVARGEQLRVLCLYAAPYQHRQHALQGLHGPSAHLQTHEHQQHWQVGSSPCNNWLVLAEVHCSWCT